MTDDAALARFDTFLEQTWIDNTEEEALALWRYRVEVAPGEAQADLAAIDAVLADPPDDLPERLTEHGWIHLVHRGRDTVVPYSREEQVEWLRAMAERLRAEAQSRPGTRSPDS